MASTAFAAEGDRSSTINTQVLNAAAVPAAVSGTAATLKKHRRRALKALKDAAKAVTITAKDIVVADAVAATTTATVYKTVDQEVKEAHEAMDAAATATAEAAQKTSDETATPAIATVVPAGAAPKSEQKVF